MPHVLLEYTQDVDLNFEDLFSHLHYIITETTGANIEKCKSRARLMEHPFVSDTNANSSMILIEICLMEGRDPAALKYLSQSIHAAVTDAVNHNSTEIAVRITEIKRETYTSTS